VGSNYWQEFLVTDKLVTELRRRENKGTKIIHNMQTWPTYQSAGVCGTYCSCMWFIGLQTQLMPIRDSN